MSGRRGRSQPARRAVVIAPQAADRAGSPSSCRFLQSLSPQSQSGRTPNDLPGVKSPAVRAGPLPCQSCESGEEMPNLSLAEPPSATVRAGPSSFLLSTAYRSTLKAKPFFRMRRPHNRSGQRRSAPLARRARPPDRIALTCPRSPRFLTAAKAPVRAWTRWVEIRCGLIGRRAGYVQRRLDRFARILTIERAAQCFATFRRNVPDSCDNQSGRSV